MRCEPGLDVAPCSDGAPAGARYLRAQDSATSHYLIVMHEKWGLLVVHAHGGPSLDTPRPTRTDEDTKRVRRIFVDPVARPRRTLLHGQP